MHFLAYLLLAQQIMGPVSQGIGLVNGGINIINFLNHPPAIMKNTATVANQAGAVVKRNKKGQVVVDSRIDFEVQRQAQQGY